MVHFIEMWDLKNFLLFCSLGVILGSMESNFSDYDISFVHITHWAHCIKSTVCVNIPLELEPFPPPIIFDNDTGIIPQLPPRIPFPDSPPPFMNDGSCCKGCSCDLAVCMLSGTCCPDLLDHLPSVEESASKIKVVCQKASLKKTVRSHLPLGLDVWMFTKCPDDYPEDETKAKCENPDDFTSWDTKIPVVHNGTNTNYQNAYCALCYDVSRIDLLNWEVAVHCLKGKLVPSSIETIIDEVITANYCNIIYNYPLQDNAMKNCKPVTSRCNVTGYWEEYDALTEAACHAYTDIYEGKYKNIFCFLCNEPKPYVLRRECIYSDGGPVWPNFSALLKFTAPPEEQVPDEENNVDALTGNKCKKSQIFDKYEKICRDLSCLPPKTLQYGQCVDIVDYLTGVTYEAFINLVPNDTVRIQDAPDVATELWNIYQAFIEELGGSDPIYEREMYYETKTSNDSLIQSFVLHCKVHFKYNHKHSNIFVNGLLSLLKEERLIISKGTGTFKMMLGPYDAAVSIYAPPDPSNNQTKRLIRLDGILPPLDIRFPDSIPKTKPTLISKVLGCPLIQLDVNTNVDQNDTVSVDPQSEYPLGSFITVNESVSVSAYVCADDFLNSAAKRYQKQETHHQSSTDDGVSAQGILSLVCTCISILCLIMTLITYALFQELRTQPGINTIALVTCLIIAQTLFQFGSGQSDSVPKWGCQTIGVLTHFFWLMVMFWMNVCSVHMFMVFIKIKKITVHKKTLKHTIIYTTYTILASGIIVVINIVVSLRRPDMNGIGYGGRMCYITDYRMVGYVFALPVGVIVVVNLAHFIAVIIKMWRLPTVTSETKHTRNFFAIYAKLSTFTGITWVFGFVYVFTGVTALEYIFIIFNASQGVFIFLAFVCNKRVISLHRNLMGRTKTILSRRLKTMKTKTANFTNIMNNAGDSK